MTLTIRNADLVGSVVSIRCINGCIDEIGPTVVSQPGDQVIDAGGLHLVPGMINGHGHAAMVLLRGYGDDMALQPWLRERIWPAEARMTAEDIRWGARLACLEMIRSGTVSFWDMYWHSVCTASAATELGLRATVGAVVFDSMNETASSEACRRATDELDQLNDFGDLITVSVAAHSVYAVSRSSLEWSATQCLSRQIPLQIHCSETQDEVRDCLDATSMTPAEYLDRVGLLGEQTCLAHGTYLTDGDIDLVARSGSTVVVNPVSNMKLAVGRAAPVGRMLAAGVQIGLGTDGASSNNGLDMFADTKIMAILAKHATADPSTSPAAEALAIARGQRSALLGGRPLAVGEPADFLLLDLRSPELCIGDADSALAFSANGSCVDTTVVAGRVLMRHRVIPDADAIVAEATDRARALTGATR